MPVRTPHTRPFPVYTPEGRKARADLLRRARAKSRPRFTTHRAIFERSLLFTVFRRRVLRLILAFAVSKLGRNAVKDVAIDTWRSQDEDSQPNITLTIRAASSPEEIAETSRWVLERLAEDARSWETKQIDDYRKSIFFSLVTDDDAAEPAL